MKKYLVLLIAMCAYFPLSAQEAFPEVADLSVSEYRRMKFERIWGGFPKFEIRAGYSGFPIADILYYGFSEFEHIFDPDHMRPEGLEGIYAPCEGATFMTGNISAEFSWHVKKWFTLAGGMYFNSLWSTMIDPSDGSVVSRTSGVTASFLPVARFYWANFEKCRLYSGIGLGVMASGYKDIGYVIPAFQLSAIGITAGSKLFFHAEYSIGTICLGAQAGIGYRF